MNAVIYARFSSSGQREESIEGQIRECSKYALSRNYQVVGTYEDRALSGTTDKRPDFQRMIYDSAKGKFDVVICWKHDRFARNRYDAALYKMKLKNNGVKIEYAAEPLSDGTEAIILDSVMEGYAEYYSANLSQNVKRGLYDSALKRQTLGQLCYGLTTAPDGTFMHEPTQAPIVKRVFEEYVSGVPTIEIIAKLNNEGFRTASGGLFGKNAVRNIISNPKYKGLYTYADIVDENGIPPIVSKELWEQANEIKESNKNAPNAKADYILTGKLFCGHCGKGMVAGGGRSHSGTYYAYYQCKSKDKKPVPKDYIEKIITDKLVEVIHSDEMIQKFADDFIQWQDTNDNNAELLAVQSRIAELEKERNRMIKAIKKGISADEFVEEMKNNRQQIDQLKYKLIELKAEKPVVERDMIVWYLERFREGDVDDPEWRKQLVKNFLQAAYLFDNGHLILQLNYNGEANTIAFDLLTEVAGSILAQFSPPECVYSNTLIFWNTYLLYQTEL